MPIYEYECLACKHRFEEIQKFSDPVIETCPQCSEKVRKIIFAPAIHFKGAGFYATEYGKSKSALGSPEAKADAKLEGKGDSKSESKGDSKSDSKGDSKPETKSEGSSESKKANAALAVAAPKDKATA